MQHPTLFCHEIKPGCLEAVKAFMHECANEQHDAYHDLLKRFDLNDTRWWIHELHGKAYLLFTHDMGPEGVQRLKKWNQNNDPFEAWFDEQLKALFVPNPDNHQPESLGGIIVR